MNHEKTADLHGVIQAEFDLRMKRDNLVKSEEMVVWLMRERRDLVKGWLAELVGEACERSNDGGMEWRAAQTLRALEEDGLG